MPQITQAKANRFREELDKTIFTASAGCCDRALDKND
jgi:hypothetical protein